MRNSPSLVGVHDGALSCSCTCDAGGLCSVLHCAQTCAVLPALCCAAQLKDWAADPGGREPDLGGVALGRPAPMPVTAAMENQAGGASVQSIIDTGECGPSRQAAHQQRRGD